MPIEAGLAAIALFIGGIGVGWYATSCASRVAEPAVDGPATASELD